MSKVRRINVSQIEGNNSNTNDSNEIRPFGEIGIYVNEDGDIDKPELLMFDGIRTHRKSKVLGNGIFYGSNADSGDGAGLDTIKLVPDTEIYRNGSDQYLIVDPTAPNHIHLRAGGIIDNSNAALILGGENSNVEVQAGLNPPVYVRANNNTWMFDVNGVLTFPGSSNARIGEDEPGLVVHSGNGFAVLTNASNINTYQVEFIGFIHNGFGDSPGATLTVTEIISGTITNGMTIYGGGLPPEGWTLTFGGVMEPQGSGGTGNYRLNGANFLTSSQTFNNGVLAAGIQSWIFDVDGNLTFPDATAQTTAFTGNAATVDITNTNGLSTTYYPTFVESRDGNEILRADVDLTYRTDTNTLTAGNISVAGSVSTGGNLNFTSAESTDTARIFAEVSGLTSSLILEIGDDNADKIVLRHFSFGAGTTLDMLTAQRLSNTEADVTVIGNITATGNIAADNFSGDGSALTGVATKTSGTWTVTPGNNIYSFTVPANGVYQLWVRGNIPGGIISYTATAAVTNGNVPVLGTQYAWNYIDAGSPILFTSIPAQFVGAEGQISTSVLSVGTTANTFVFGINNNTLENVIVRYGYTKIS
jgi:hypothetical protein